MIAVIGAGLAGLSFAQLIGDQLGPLTLIEKSRGVGGRLATRRWDEARFDHGTQTLGNIEHQPSLGMTSYAKKLAKDKNILLQKKLVRLINHKTHWSLELEDGESLKANAVVLTCPLPQSLAILEQSQIPFSPELSGVQYEKALLALVKISQSLQQNKMDFKSDQIEAIYDQQQKGLSPVPAWTVLMTKEYAQKNFDRVDEDLKNEIQNFLQNKFSGDSIVDLQIKKWRYSRVINPLTQDWMQIQKAPALYLIGDAFAGGDLQGALKSAQALAHIFVSEKKNIDVSRKK